MVVLVVAVVAAGEEVDVHAQEVEVTPHLAERGLLPAIRR